METQMLQAIHLLQRQAASLLIYQSVLQGDIGQDFLNVLQTLRQTLQASQQASQTFNETESAFALLSAYGRWFHALAAHQQSWQDYLMIQILNTENPFTQQAQQRDLADLPADLVAAARQDLRSLRSLYVHDAAQISQWIQAIAPLSIPLVAYTSRGESTQSLGELPIWKKLEAIADWGEILEDLALHYRQSGVGLFAQYKALRWQSGRLMGIAYPDPIRLEELVGYETQQQALTQNTEALLNGYPALHVLLYGSRGSGKSSLVKGLLHRYGDRNLRLIEVAKSDLKELITIVEQVRTVPQKFIIFVDDLSFEEDEDAYKALKVILEGNLTARPQNLVVYATSNRRHLIREFFGDRPRPKDADEVHQWDTVQEKLSFSDRFGLTLTFEPANQDVYLAIVRHLAQQAKVAIDPADLEYRALQWATRHNGRSGRTARQFMDFLIAEQHLNQ
jgi:uncharacterized protein